MKVGVCDFPSAYEFPPRGYGGIERWLWSVAVGAQRAGAEVHLIGPAWRRDLPSTFERLPVRLEGLTPGDVVHRELRARRFDLLVVGHEYPSLPAWRRAWLPLGCEVVSHQQDANFRHRPGAFDGTRSRLYCYSPEMMRRYADQQPRLSLCTHFGLGEENPPAASPGTDAVVWVGRIDREKAPHLAVLATQRLGLRLRLVGPVFDRGYVQEQRSLFAAPHVEWLGELAATAKLEAIGGSRVLTYTCAPDYVEAAGAVFGESLRSGTPVAALAWRDGTSADAALCPGTGAVARVGSLRTEEEVAQRLAEAIEQAGELDARQVQEIGLSRFDPAAHFRQLAGHHDEDAGGTQSAPDRRADGQVRGAVASPAHQRHHHA